MRRDSSTVVAAVGEVSPSLLADVGRSANVAAVRGGEADLDAVAQTLREAARKPAPYVLVTADPLAGIAAGWQATWDLAAGDTVPAVRRRPRPSGRCSGTCTRARGGRRSTS